MSGPRGSRRPPRLAPIAWLLLASLATPGRARAQEELPSTEGSAATDLVRAGVALRREHKDAEALATFRRAYGRAPVPSTLAQIAFAEQALGKWIDAERDLQAAMAEQDGWIVRHRPQLEEALRAIQGNLGWLRIEGAGDADVRLDDARVQPGEEIRTTAGAHRVILRTGTREIARVVSVEPRAHASALFEIPPEAPAPPAAPPPRPARPLTGPLVLGGMAAAGLATGGYFGVRTLTAKSDREDHCHADNTCDPVGLDADSRMRTSATVSTVAFGVGLAAAVGAVVWWRVSRTASVTAALGGPGGPVGAALIGRF